MSITGFPGQRQLVCRPPGKHHSFRTLAVRPCCAPVRAGGCRGLWRAVHRLKHPTCRVRNVYHRLPGPAPACPPRTGQAARITSAPLFAPAVSMNVHRGLWRAVRRLKHPTCPVRNVYQRLPGPPPACPPPAGQAPQFPHPCCPPPAVPQCAQAGARACGGPCAG